MAWRTHSLGNFHSGVAVIILPWCLAAEMEPLRIFLLLSVCFQSSSKCLTTLWCLTTLVMMSTDTNYMCLEQRIASIPKNNNLEGRSPPSLQFIICNGHMFHLWIFKCPFHEWLRVYVNVYEMICRCTLKPYASFMLCSQIYDGRQLRIRSTGGK